MKNFANRTAVSQLSADDQRVISNKTTSSTNTATLAVSTGNKLCFWQMG